MVTRTNPAQHPQVDEKVGDTIADRYELTAQIGGGHGALFSARDQFDDREVAIKIFDPTKIGPDSLQRYAVRLAKLAAVKHPAIVLPRIQIATTNSPPFVVGELLQGEDLAALCERTRPLPWPRALAIVRACAEGLAAVHAATGVAHGALRPGNVWLAADGQIQVLDLGISELGAVPLRPRLDGSFAEYRAPEQLEGSPADARSDVFSLGVLLFEALTGTHPFTAPSEAAVTIKVLMQPAPAATRVPPPVAALLARTLARAAKNRIADAGALARELAALIPANAQVAAAPPAPGDPKSPAPSDGPRAAGAAIAGPRAADAPATSDMQRVASAAIASPGTTNAPVRFDERRAPAPTMPTPGPMPARGPTIGSTAEAAGPGHPPELPLLRAESNERTEALPAPHGWASRGATSVRDEPDTRTEVSLREPSWRPTREETQVLANPNVRTGSSVPTTTLREDDGPARSERTQILDNPNVRAGSSVPTTTIREEHGPARSERTLILDNPNVRTGSPVPTTTLRDDPRPAKPEETQVLANPNVRTGSSVPTTTLRDEHDPPRSEGPHSLDNPVPRGARASTGPASARREAPQPAHVEATVLLDADELPTRVQGTRVPVELLRALPLANDAPPPIQPDAAPTRRPAPPNLLVINLCLCLLTLIGVTIWLLFRE